VTPGDGWGGLGGRKHSALRCEVHQGMGAQLEGKDKEWQHRGASESTGKYWVAWEVLFMLYLFGCCQGIA